MKIIDKIYINGQFVTPHGSETFDLISPVNQELLGRVTLGDETDTINAIAAAKAAFKTFSQTSREERIAYLEKMYAAIEKRKEEMIATMIREYGGTQQFASGSFAYTLSSISSNIAVLRDFPFEQTLGSATVLLEPVGVVGIITPWNASNSFIANKLSTAIAAGCTAVIKPSEMSAMQTQLMMEALHEAGLPAGVFNIVNGLGAVVGAEITRNTAISKISFTGSTAVGKSIARDGADTVKRITLELGGKSPNIIMEDANLAEAIPLSVAAAFMNNGQACIAATRLLVPASKMEEVKSLLRTAVANVKVGDPSDPATQVGPMISKKQFERVQGYIQLGIAEGATLLIGGPGQPAGLEKGNFVQPTVFVDVNNNMRIAREEIFGPVLSVIPYHTLEEAIDIANDTTYGLAAYVQGTDIAKAKKVAAKLEAGRVAINGFKHDPMAPFGGFKQSGLGREFGVYGLEAYLEPKTILS
ncbi:aldehyde dehydrogenase family protein [Chitinophaga sp. sic0106]|uniref:aldehyde dehydrogenase family protein n=1 Tax=Chitinophaga sp. sic0106 TaxID=2854785 RepID=UPI001C48F583|nr:aldehyde dehydrogenase family protein [Chitinophaga sp. sic0106]MBV7532097.1 aldehyde dehydrogenase family protein [Chitinophaga sp. sic0106]